MAFEVRPDGSMGGFFHCERRRTVFDTDIDERIAEQRAEVKRLEAERDRLQGKAEAEEERIKEPLRRKFRGVVGYAEQRGHSWPGRRPPFFGSDETGDEDALVEYLAELSSQKETRVGSGSVCRAAEGEVREAKKELRRSYEWRKTLRKIAEHVE